jgi:hypothetical protein
MAVLGSVAAVEGARVPAEVQGGAFWSEDRDGLYLAANGDCSVYRLDVSDDAATRGTVAFLFSDDYDKRLHTYEMEGLTFWDLGAGVDGGDMHMFGNFMEAKKKSLHSYKHVRTAATSHKTDVELYDDAVCLDRGESCFRGDQCCSGRCTSAAAVVWTCA